MTLRLRSYLLAAAVASAAMLASCQTRDKDVPSERKMAAVIADMQIAEAYMRVAPNADPDSMRSVLRQSVLMKHGLTQEQYDAGMAWYGMNMDRFTDLYTEVEKRIDRREKRLVTGRTEAAGRQGDASDIWPFDRMQMLSALGNTDALFFAINEPELKPGERLKWTMLLSNNPGASLTLGVDYDDGSYSFFNRRFTGEKRLQADLQTDSVKTVTRIFGAMRVDARSMMPIWADSLALSVAPFAPEMYSQIAMLNSYSQPIPPSQRAKADTIKAADSVKEEQMLIDEPNPLPRRPGFSAR